MRYFENIHLFANGNGRVIKLFEHDYDIPPITIFDEDKKFYYECLIILLRKYK